MRLRKPSYWGWGRAFVLRLRKSLCAEVEEEPLCWGWGRAFVLRLRKILRSELNLFLTSGGSIDHSNPEWRRSLVPIMPSQSIIDYFWLKYRAMNFSQGFYSILFSFLAQYLNLIKYTFISLLFHLWFFLPLFSCILSRL